MYGITYGIMKKNMKKTTLYLPDDLKELIEEAATHTKRSEADVIREAIASGVRRLPPLPRVPLPGVRLGDPTIAERVADLMDGFGQ